MKGAEREETKVARSSKNRVTVCKEKKRTMTLNHKNSKFSLVWLFHGKIVLLTKPDLEGEGFAYR